MTTKPDPQRRQTHEQLRLEHIIVLEDLQRYKDENDQLKEQLKVRSDPPQVVIQVDKTESFSDYVSKIRKQEKEMADLKTLMKKAALEDQQRFNQIHTRTVEEFSQQLNKMHCREKELTSQVDTLQHKLDCIPLLESRILQLEEENTTSKSTVQTLSSKIAERDKEIQELISQLLASQQAVRDMENSNQSLQTAFSTPFSCIICVQNDRMLQEKDQQLAEYEMEVREWG
ncbi:hypothetical protein EON65_00415, partial [archaeon]